jgi:hypothetical protein
MPLERYEIIVIPPDAAARARRVNAPLVADQARARRQRLQFPDRRNEAGRDAGALGGKLLGAGGGGFMVLLVDPEKRAQVRERCAS